MLRNIFLLFICVSLNAGSQEFRLSGSNTIGQELAKACAKGYLAEQGFTSIHIEKIDTEAYIVVGKGVQGQSTIKIEAKGSSTGFNALLTGNADLAMSSRPIKANEAASLLALGDMQSAQAEQTIGIDGLSIITHPENPVSALTLHQLAAIFSGELTNWQQVGGLNLPINLYARDQHSGTWDTFKKLVLGKHYALTNEAERFTSNHLLAHEVQKDLQAIGFVGLSSVGGSKLIAISDADAPPMRPNKFTVGTEDYPLSRRLYLYLPTKQPNDEALAFINFCQSFEGQKLVEKMGFVSQNIQRFEVAPTQHMPTYYQKLAGRAERLSLNLRFNEGSPQLDTKALKDIERLAHYLSAINTNYPYVYLIGFSEKGNRFSQDVVLSRFRALAVRSALLRHDITIASSHGLGSFLPVANNNDTNSKKKNARVEVWVSRRPIQFD